MRLIPLGLGPDVQQDEVLARAEAPVDLERGYGFRPARHLVPDDVRRVVQDVHGAVERRRIGEVEVGYVIDARAKRDGGDEDVGAPCNLAFAGHLTAEHPSADRVDDQLHRDHLRARVVARAVETGDERCQRPVADRPRVAFAESDASHVQFEDLHDGGAQDPRECVVASRGICPYDPTVLVRGRTHGREDLRTGDPVHVLDAVPAGIDARVARLHVLVHRDAARRPDEEAGVTGELHVRTRAECEHDEVGVHLALLGDNLSCVSVRIADDGDNPLPEPEVDPVGRQFLLRICGHLGVEQAMAAPCRAPRRRSPRVLSAGEPRPLPGR